MDWLGESLWPSGAGSQSARGFLVQKAPLEASGLPLSEVGGGARDTGPLNLEALWDAPLSEPLRLKGSDGFHPHRMQGGRKAQERGTILGQPPRRHAGQPPRLTLPSDADSRDADLAGGGEDWKAVPSRDRSLRPSERIPS